MTWSTMLFLFFAINRVMSFYDSDSGVKILTEKNFVKFVKRQSITLVEFYAPWCGHCKNLKPEYIKAAKELKDIIPLAAVDADEQSNKALAAKYEIKGFPTLKLFKNGKVADFGARTADEIVEQLKKELSDEYLTVLTDKNVDEFMGLKRRKVIVFTNDGKPDQIVKSVSMRFHRQIAFGFATKAENSITKQFKVKSFPKVILLENKKNPKPEDLGEYSAKNLKKQIVTALGPENNEFEQFDIVHDNSCFRKYCVVDGNLCVLYVESGSKDEISRRRTILQEARDDLVDESFFKF
ncbi:hypothetical protein MHBO_003141, partial [Bonamia ostreae]